MQPIDVLHAVRQGYALATPKQMEALRGCRGLEVLGHCWVPRWVLEAETSLEKAGCPVPRIRELIELGREAVNAELAVFVREGKLAHVLEPRLPTRRMSIDLPTEMALTAALQHHREACFKCRFDQPCAEGEDLEDEIEMLFPRKHHPHGRA